MKLKFIFSSSFFAFTITASAQVGISSSDSIAEVVISENRLQIPFNKRNRDIQIIDKYEIAKMPVKSINEILVFFNGLDVRQRGAFGTQADISIDGGSFEQVLILWNGVKVSDPQTAHHTMNLPIPLDAIERIEILRGSMARVYGANALTGAINIITKPSETTLSIHLQGGSSFQTKEEGDGKGVYQGAQLQFMGQYLNQKHQHMLAVSKQQNNGQRYNSASEDTRISYQGGYDLKGENTIEWGAGFIDNAFGANGYYAYPGDKESYELVKTGIGYLSSKHQIGEHFYFSPRISYRYNKDDYRYYRHDLAKARSNHENNIWSAEINSRYTISLGVIGLGLEYRDEKVHSNNLGNHSRSNFGSYLEYRTQILSALHFHIGAYSNYNSDYGWQLYPGVDVGYQWNRNWKVNANIGKSQRIPSFTDLYLNQALNIGNDALKPENALQYEIAVQGFMHKINVEGRYFYREISDFIDWIKHPQDNVDMDKIPFQAHNFGSTRIHGLGLSMQQKLVIDGKSSIFYKIGYNHLVPKELSYPENMQSKYVLENLKHQAILQLHWSALKWNVSTANRWIQRERNKAYFINDWRLSYTLNAFSYYFDVNNLSNAQYIESGAVLMPRRWLAFGVKYKLRSENPYR